MSEPANILSYEHVTVPEVRTRQVALGAGILALEALLLLLYRYFGEQAMYELVAVGGMRRAGNILTPTIYSLLSICVPVAVWLLAGAKLPRMEAGRVVGTGRVRAAKGLALGYCGCRLLTDVFWIPYVLERIAAAPGSGEMWLMMARLCSCGATIFLAGLQVAGWMYMADLAARLRRGVLLPLATAAFGVSLLIVSAMLVMNIHRMVPVVAPEVVSVLNWVVQGPVLSGVQLVYWGVVGGMMMGKSKR